MRNFYMQSDYVDIMDDNHLTHRLFFTKDSGKVFYRYKINTISNVKHPGIFLGTDQHGQAYFLHNHFHFGKAVVDKQQSFASGQTLYPDARPCANDWHTIIRNGLQQVINGETYSFHSYNCQTFTNVACHNERKSEDVNKWGQRIAISAVVVLVCTTLFNSKS